MNRRDFLKLLGAAVATLGVGGWKKIEPEATTQAGPQPEFEDGDDDWGMDAPPCYAVPYSPPADYVAKYNSGAWAEIPPYESMTDAEKKEVCDSVFSNGAEESSHFRFTEEVSSWKYVLRVGDTEEPVGELLQSPFVNLREPQKSVVVTGLSSVKGKLEEIAERLGDNCEGDPIADFEPSSNWEHIGDIPNASGMTIEDSIQWANQPMRRLDNFGASSEDIKARVAELMTESLERVWVDGEPGGEVVGILNDDQKVCDEDLGGYIVPPDIAAQLTEAMKSGEPLSRTITIDTSWDSSVSEIQRLIDVSRKRGIDEETIRQHALEVAVRDLYGVDLDDCYIVPVAKTRLWIMGQDGEGVLLETKQYKDTALYLGYDLIGDRHVVAYRWGEYVPHVQGKQWILSPPTECPECIAAQQTRITPQDLAIGEVQIAIALGDQSVPEAQRIEDYAVMIDKSSIMICDSFCISSGKVRELHEVGMSKNMSFKDSFRTAVLIVGTDTVAERQQAIKMADEADSETLQHKITKHNYCTKQKCFGESEWDCQP